MDSREKSPGPSDRSIQAPLSRVDPYGREAGGALPNDPRLQFEFGRHSHFGTASVPLPSEIVAMKARGVCKSNVDFLAETIGLSDYPR